jgi:serine/threonine-protein kinase
MDGTAGTEGTAGWPLAPGTTLGKYRIIRFVGEGGMGAVYEGLHIDIGKRVAIKTISPALAAIPEARARFLLEAQLTSRVRHPHTVDVTDVGMEAGQVFLVMEYLEGEDLAKHLRRRGPLPVEDLVDIALPILAAVAAAHEEGIVHRDLKPQNIFLAQMRDGSIHPKVLDFGISKRPASSAITSSGMILGSPSYFAPEQVSDQKAISPASDQYALGVILYECVTGLLPFAGSNLAAIFQAIASGSCQPAKVIRPDLPEEFERVITRAMSLAPGDRYPSVKEMGRALLEFASPKTRLVWEDHFTATSVLLRAGTTPFPVPVTDQTPGPERAPLFDTASIPGRRQSEAWPVDHIPSWVQAPMAPPPESSDPSLAVPRRFRSGPVIAGALVVAASLVAIVALKGRPRTPPVAQPSPPAAATARPSTAAAAPPVPVAADRAPAPASDRGAAISKPKPEPNVQTARQGRGAPRARFGPNRAPLIE